MARCSIAWHIEKNFCKSGKIHLIQDGSCWTVVGTGTFDGSGNFSFTNAVTPGASKQFYRIRVP
jgi:hypothetical protein